MLSPKIISPLLLNTLFSLIELNILCLNRVITVNTVYGRQTDDRDGILQGFGGAGRATEAAEEKVMG